VFHSKASTANAADSLPIRIAQVTKLMTSFAERTGLDSPRAPRRCLWTDAFAVCNFLGLARITGRATYVELALRLVDQVHHTLGRHRADDVRTGFISGLSAEQADLHPTLGGLRVGKPLPERRPDEPFDEALEWKRDGQYFHYLTKWMHALDQVARSTGEPRFNLWARELSRTAYAAFRGPDRDGVASKMSIDLRKPLVAAPRQHDALDGFVTFLVLQMTASSLPHAATEPALENEALGLVALVGEGRLATADPLGIGGLLTDASRVARLTANASLDADDLLDALLAAALGGLRRYVATGELEQSASRRLAFRELGLAIGLHAIDWIAAEIELEPQRFSQRDALLRWLTKLASFSTLAASIESFWLDAANRETAVWAEHVDMNEVMLATSLAPLGFLDLTVASRVTLRSR
jgi:hypothetical protein